MTITGDHACSRKRIVIVGAGFSGLSVAVRVEVRPEVEDRYMQWVGEDLEETMWARGGCQSWYLDDGGRPSLMWPRVMWGFRRMLRRFDLDHYRVRPPGDVAQRETNHDPGGQRFPVASQQPGMQRIDP